jgi:hypothetical protein
LTGKEGSHRDGTDPRARDRGRRSGRDGRRALGMGGERLLPAARHRGEAVDPIHASAPSGPAERHDLALHRDPARQAGRPPARRLTRGRVHANRPPPTGLGGRGSSRSSRPGPDRGHRRTPAPAGRSPGLEPASPPAPGRADRDRPSPRSPRRRRQSEHDVSAHGARGGNLSDAGTGDPAAPERE